jgi:Matrixin
MFAGDFVDRLDHYKLSQKPTGTIAFSVLTIAAMLFAATFVHAQSSPLSQAHAAQEAIESVAPDSKLRASKHFHQPHTDDEKYVLFGDPSQLKGWNNGIVRWRYNDSGRNALIAGASTAAETITTIQAAQAKWSAVCNVQFIYEGTTTAVPTPTNMTGSNLDGISTIGWGVLSGSQTGVAGVAYSGSAFPLPIVEGDMIVNNAFIYSLPVTLLHEMGHMLGIDHSNVSNVVMSGPPLTSYVSLNTLQSDDIAACVFLYGAPVATSRTISGTISNGSPQANITFCARPATGVTCTASNGSGAYSCTVPNGWTGLLHAPAPSGLRIKPMSFTNVTANLSGQNPVVQSIGSCNLDVDNNGLIEADFDGVAILRRLHGFNSTAFGGLSGTCAGNTTATAVYNATTSTYNVTGGLATLATTDGTVIQRAMRGLTGTSVTNGLGLSAESGATNTNWITIRNYLNTTCGADFLP